MKCDNCPYEKKGKLKKNGQERMPQGFQAFAGRILCPQCLEMNKKMVFDGANNKAYAYLRASTTKQDITLDDQRRVIQQYCDVRGLEIVAWFVDQASASKNKFVNRKAGREVWHHIEKGNHLVVAKYDRAWRDVADCNTMFDKLCHLGINMHFAAEGGLVPATAHGRFVLNVMVSAAQYEADTISERQKSARRARGLTDRPLLTGSPVIGFVKKQERDKETGKPYWVMLIHEESRKHCSIFLDWRVRDSLPYEAIRRRAMREKIKPPPEIRENNGLLGEFYVYTRIRKMIQLEKEFREIEKNADRELTLREVGDIWQKEYQQTQRTMATDNNK